jgi:hypothetical protein
MRIKTLRNIRSNTNPSGEMAAEATSILDPQAAWVRSTMTEAKRSGASLKLTWR